MFGGDENEGNTRRVVGTYDYMAPEYAIDGLFSIKSDVFSFGILLLEIISGKKNKGLSYTNHGLTLIGHAWRLWNEDVPLKFLDPCLKDSCIVSEREWDFNPMGPKGTILGYGYPSGYYSILLRKFTAFSTEWNTKGQCAIHLACKSGHVEVVKEFLQQEWPVATSLLNKKGENILHAAANNGKENVVKFLLRSFKIDKSIINGKDNDGNTPLHLASKHFYPEVLFSLTQDKRTILNIQNNEGLTALDMFLVHSEVPRTVQEKLSHWILSTSGGDQTEEGRRVLRGHQETPIVDWIKDRVNTVALVAMLIATMTFAAGLLVPVPASVSSSGETDEHKTQCAAVSINRTMLQVYTICNAVATYSSAAASFILSWTQADNYHLVRQVYKFALHLVSMAILAMTVAFMTAVRLNLSNASCLANVITIIGIIFLSFIFVVFCLLAFPVRYC
ncbi:hypothetical protein L6164_017836 [Bauhinia variegata]|uniref:Uncharacterized protein n=1 Tax=Bauhinia variegata TaxID=167791 RepID=A0ACB9NBA4_BAUVA|nr:hypothetical protein L6164_017836 [Bauhinia variegata]